MRRSPAFPLLLRLLHGLTAVATLGAIATALWTYDTYDGRWFRVYLPRWTAIEGIHGTLGLWSLLLFPAFALYAFDRGRSRLIQNDTVAQVRQLGSPRGWYALHRLTDTVALLSLTVALFTGKMMDEHWLPRGELHHRWYYAHLASWVLLVAAIALHVLLAARVGGLPLLKGMWSRRPDDGDRLKRWTAAAVPALDRLSWRSLRNWLVNLWQRSPVVLRWVEGAIAIAWICAWLLSLLKG